MNLPSSGFHCLPPTFDVLCVTDVPASSGVIPHYVRFTATAAGGFTAPDLLRMSDFTANVSHVPVGSTVEVQRTTLLPPLFADADTGVSIVNTAPATTSGDGRVVYVDYSNVKGFDAARTLPLGSLTGDGGRFGAGLFEDQLYSMQASMH